MTQTLERFASTINYRFFVDYSADYLFAYCQDADSVGDATLHIRNVGGKPTLYARNPNLMPLCQAKFKGLRDRRFVTGTQIHARYALEDPAINNDRICLECADYAVETAGYYG